MKTQWWDSPTIICFCLDLLSYQEMDAVTSQAWMEIFLQSGVKRPIACDLKKTQKNKTPASVKGKSVAQPKPLGSNFHALWWPRWRFKCWNCIETNGPTSISEENSLKKKKKLFILVGCVRVRLCAHVWVCIWYDFIHSKNTTVKREYKGAFSNQQLQPMSIDEGKRFHFEGTQRL